MQFFPNAKINLGLAVTHRRSDGYHDLETLFLPVPGLHDVLTVEPAETLSFSQGDELDCAPEDNLVVKAYRAVLQQFSSRVQPVDITLEKRIPFGAGLGGGSADAAFMVKALNELFSLGMTNEQMEDLVSPLGADCAFFIQNRPRFARGIGNIFSEPNQATLAEIAGKTLVLVKPDCAVSTAHAYRGICPRDQRPDTEFPKWHNDFEDTVFPLFPEIAAVKQQLIDMGADFASMSGSGATVFAIFSQQPEEVRNMLHDRFSYFTHIEPLPSTFGSASH